MSKDDIAMYLVVVMAAAAAANIVSCHSRNSANNCGLLSGIIDEGVIFSCFRDLWSFKKSVIEFIAMCFDFFLAHPHKLDAYNVLHAPLIQSQGERIQPIVMVFTLASATSHFIVPFMTLEELSPRDVG